MVIEQTLMRNMKCVGGLTRGRGITDSILTKWTLGMTATHDICSSLEEFCGVFFPSSEQHEDIRKSRRNRDAADIDKLSTWFDNHPPFPELQQIMSIATGIIGDVTVTCFNAIAVGKQSIQKIIGKSFSSVSFSRKDRALPLASMSCTITIDGNSAVVDPLLLFQRISITKKTEEDLIKYMQYELAPFPLALFDETGMRKTKKASLYDIFEIAKDKLVFDNYHIVIDGGFLLHKVIWPTGSTASSICQNYVNYISKHYPGKCCTVVFDGYSNVVNSTKGAEHHRRYKMKKSVDMHFDINTKLMIKQDLFLSNDSNKFQLITMLRAKFSENNIECYESTGDADSLIVKTAIDKSSSGSNVVIIGEDVDLMVLLTALTPTDQEILFMKPSHGKVETKIFSSRQFEESRLKDGILFLHAISGCDSTSSTYRKGKTTCFNLFKKHEDLLDIANVFSNSESTHEAVAEACNRYFLRLYGASSTETSLNFYRYKLFTKLMCKVKPDISTLPPTEGAARQHAYRVYHQIQLWLGNQLPPELWGWRFEHTHLIPIKTKEPIAPAEVLRLIFCRCTTGCGAKCGCRKAAMFCTTCCNCLNDCDNRVPLDDEGEDDLLIPSKEEQHPEEQNE